MIILRFMLCINKEKEMSKFKCGDKVVCRDEFLHLGEDFVFKGGEYIVSKCCDYFIEFEGREKHRYPTKAFELIRPAFKNMKFKVSSPEHSKEIQEALFEMGFCWRSYGCKVMFTDSFPPCDYLYTDKEGHLWRIDSEEDYLVSSFKSAQEYTIETTKSYKLIPVVTVKQSISINGTLTIDGKTYDKEAVLKRLAELEEVK